LDYAGVDFYPQLLPSSTIPTSSTPVSAAVAGFSSNYSGIDYLTEMKAFMTKAGKPIIITETGTMNWNGACFQPWNYGGNSANNEAAQSLFWEALLQWLDDNSSTIPVEGIAGWMWRPSSTDAGAIGYSIWGRAAYTPVAAWFKAQTTLASATPAVSTTTIVASSTSPDYPVTPPAPSIGAIGSLDDGGVYLYQLVHINTTGHSAPSPAMYAAAGSTKAIPLSWPPDSTVTSTQIYRYGYFLAEVTGNSYLDVGLKSTSVKIPLVAGPKV
jgi:hypothetical protein